MADPVVIDSLPVLVEGLKQVGIVVGGILALIGTWMAARYKGKTDLATAKAQAEVERERTLLDGLSERVQHLEDRVKRLEEENLELESAKRELKSENHALRSTNLTLEETLAASIELIKAWEAFEASGFSTPPGRPSPTWPIRPYLKPPEEMAHKVAEAAEKLQEVLED